MKRIFKVSVAVFILTAAATSHSYAVDNSIPLSCNAAYKLPRQQYIDPRGTVAYTRGAAPVLVERYGALSIRSASSTALDRGYEISSSTDYAPLINNTAMYLSMHPENLLKALIAITYMDDAKSDRNTLYYTHLLTIRRAGIDGRFKDAITSAVYFAEAYMLGDRVVGDLEEEAVGAGINDPAPKLTYYTKKKAKFIIDLSRGNFAAVDKYLNTDPDIAWMVKLNKGVCDNGYSK